MSGMRKIDPVRPRTREQITFVVTVVYAAMLLGVASVIQWGDLAAGTRLGVAAVAIPAACVGALILMRQWRGLDR